LLASTTKKLHFILPFTTLGAKLNQTSRRVEIT
jgi:hypothetical protein